MSDTKDFKTGWIDAYFPNRGFGFIHSIEDGNLRRYYFHVASIISGFPAPQAKVTCEIDTARVKPGNPVLPVHNIAVIPKLEVTR